MFDYSGHEKVAAVAFVLLLGFIISFSLFIYYGFNENGWFVVTQEFPTPVPETTTNPATTTAPATTTSPATTTLPPVTTTLEATTTLKATQETIPPKFNLTEDGKIALGITIPLLIIFILAMTMKYGYNYEAYFARKLRKVEVEIETTAIKKVFGDIRKHSTNIEYLSHVYGDSIFEKKMVNSKIGLKPRYHVADAKTDPTKQTTEGFTIREIQDAVIGYFTHANHDPKLFEEINRKRAQVEIV